MEKNCITAEKALKGLHMYAVYRDSDQLGVIVGEKASSGSGNRVDI